MEGKRKTVTEEQAQETSTKFLLDRYPSGKITFAGVTLTTRENMSSYCVEGEVKLRAGSLVAQFLWPPDCYRFRIWVSAATGKLLSWEMQ